MCFTVSQHQQILFLILKTRTSSRVNCSLTEYDVCTVLYYLVDVNLQYSSRALHFLLRTNIATQALARGNLCLVVLAVDSVPIDELLHLPHLARQRNVPHMFLPSKTGMSHCHYFTHRAIFRQVYVLSLSLLNKQIHTHTHPIIYRFIVIREITALVC